jgi:hypothetical protein
MIQFEPFLYSLFTSNHDQKQLPLSELPPAFFPASPSASIIQHILIHDYAAITATKHGPIAAASGKVKATKFSLTTN